MFQVLQLSVLEHFEQKNIWNIWMVRWRKFVYKALISILKLLTLIVMCISLNYESPLRRQVNKMIDWKSRLVIVTSWTVFFSIENSRTREYLNNFGLALIWQ